MQICTDRAFSGQQPAQTPRRITDHELECIPRAIYNDPTSELLLRDEGNAARPTRRTVYELLALNSPDVSASLAFLSHVPVRHDLEEEDEQDQTAFDSNGALRDTDQDETNQEGRTVLLTETGIEILNLWAQEALAPLAKAPMASPLQWPVHSAHERGMLRPFGETMRYGSIMNTLASTNAIIAQQCHADCAAMFATMQVRDRASALRYPRKFVPSEGTVLARGLSFRATGRLDEVMGWAAVRDEEGGRGDVTDVPLRSSAVTPRHGARVDFSEDFRPETKLVFVAESVVVPIVPMPVPVRIARVPSVVAGGRESVGQVKNLSAGMEAMGVKKRGVMPGQTSVLEVGTGLELELEVKHSITPVSMSESRPVPERVVVRPELTPAVVVTEPEMSDSDESAGMEALEVTRGAAEAGWNSVMEEVRGVVAASDTNDASPIATRDEDAPSPVGRVVVLAPAVVVVAVVAEPEVHTKEKRAGMEAMGVKKVVLEAERKSLAKEGNVEISATVMNDAEPVATREEDFPPLAESVMMPERVVVRPALGHSVAAAAVITELKTLKRHKSAEIEVIGLNEVVLDAGRKSVKEEVRGVGSDSNDASFAALADHKATKAITAVAPVTDPIVETAQVVDGPKPLSRFDQLFQNTEEPVVVVQPVAVGPVIVRAAGRLDVLMGRAHPPEATKKVDIVNVTAQPAVAPASARAASVASLVMAKDSAPMPVVPASGVSTASLLVAKEPRTVAVEPGRVASAASLLVAKESRTVAFEPVRVASAASLLVAKEPHPVAVESVRVTGGASSLQVKEPAKVSVATVVVASLALHVEAKELQIVAVEPALVSSAPSLFVANDPVHDPVAAVLVASSASLLVAKEPHTVAVEPLRAAKEPANIPVVPVCLPSTASLVVVQEPHNGAVATVRVASTASLVMAKEMDNVSVARVEPRAAKEGRFMNAMDAHRLEIAASTIVLPSASTPARAISTLLESKSIGDIPRVSTALQAEADAEKWLSNSQKIVWKDKKCELKISELALHCFEVGKKKQYRDYLPLPIRQITNLTIEKGTHIRIDCVLHPKGETVGKEAKDISISFDDAETARLWRANLLVLCFGGYYEESLKRSVVLLIEKGDKDTQKCYDKYMREVFDCAKKSSRTLVVQYNEFSVANILGELNFATVGNIICSSEDFLPRLQQVLVRDGHASNPSVLVCEKDPIDGALSVIRSAIVKHNISALYVSAVKMTRIESGAFGLFKK